MESNRVAYIFNNVPVSREELSSNFSRLSQIDKTAPFIITPTSDVTIDAIVDIMDEVYSQGLTGTHLILGSTNGIAHVFLQPTGSSDVSK